MVEAGQPLLPDVLCEIHRKINEDYYGPDFVADRFISYEWARIPHFYRAFYVYQYATGISAAVAIANRIRKLGQPAIEDYKNFLRSGSSDHPIELLKIAGVDMASPQPILDIIEDFTRPSNSWKSCCKSEVQRTLEKAAPVPKRTPPFYVVGQGAVLLFCSCCDKMLRRKQAG